MEIFRAKNVATRIVFPIVDADGDLVTGATGLDSEIDQWADGANPTGFADCTNEATEIGTTGIYYLILTQTEMNEDYIVVQVKTSSSGAKTQVILINTTPQTSINTIDDFLDTEIAAIKAKTDNLPSDPADASDIASSFTTVNTKLDTIDDFLDTEVAAIKAKTDNLPSDPADASDIASSFTTVNGKLDTIDDFLDTEVAAIKAKTDNLPNDPADASDIASSFTTVNTKLDTIDDFLDTEVAAIKAKTDNLPSDPADASDIASSFSTVNTKLDTIDDFLDTEIAAIKAKTDNLPAAIKKNTALSNFMFMMYDSSDHVTPKTGLAVTATRSIDGAAFAACANAVTEVANGWYKINLAAADLNGDFIALKFNASGADARNLSFPTNT